MIKSFLKKQILKNRALIIREGKYLQDFMRLLMKQSNTGIEWTEEEKMQLKSDLKHISLYVPALIIFVLPFGALLLPVLTEVLDRRDKDRMK
ncbi:MAG: hypothetical protein EHM30_15555 [Desulfobacteraceae bacterium]|nr:MAG: hypothetical protein EHM30_15555 [Desulfobacteraceae bacterium]